MPNDPVARAAVKKIDDAYRFAARFSYSATRQMALYDVARNEVESLIDHYARAVEALRVAVGLIEEVVSMPHQLQRNLIGTHPERNITGNWVLRARTALACIEKLTEGEE